MGRTWLSVRVELICGRGEDYWPRPGRLFAAARSHTFEELATAIDDAFARWDRAHLHEFTLANGSRVGLPSDDDWDPEHLLDIRRVRMSRLNPGEQFAYIFDLGDDWQHLCTVGTERIDPLTILGIVPYKPLPFWGWGVIPDQYGRRWDGDDGESKAPRDPHRADLPPILGDWR